MAILSTTGSSAFAEKSRDVPYNLITLLSQFCLTLDNETLCETIIDSR